MGASSSEIVRVETKAEVIASDHSSWNFPISLIYDPTDPYAVQLVISPVVESKLNAISCRFARELLAESLMGPTGVGDIKIQPWSGPHGNFLVINLAATAGFTRVQLTRSIVDRFIRRAYLNVPKGHEREAIDIDHEVEATIRRIISEQTES